MKMQFKITSQAQSMAVQAALFAAGYQWASGDKHYLDQGDNIYLVTGMFGGDDSITYGHSPSYGYNDYVVVDGKIYKEGEEPKFKFKAGDKVLRLETSFFGTLQQGETYTVKEVNGSILRLEGIDSTWSDHKFDLAPAEQMAVFDDLAFDAAPALQRPPLGLRPASIADLDKVALDKARLVEILEAMLRYAQADMVIPDAWDNEYDHIRESLNEFYSPEDPFNFVI